MSGSGAPSRGGGLVDRLLSAYGNIRASMTRLLSDRPSEATLLSLLMFAGLVAFAGQTLEHSAVRWDPNAPAFAAAWEERYRAANIEAAKAGLPPRPALETLSAEERALALNAAMRDKLQSDRIGHLIQCFLLLPLGVYLFAALAAPLLRWAGGTGGGYETRAAFTWALVVASPFLLAKSVVDMGLISLAGGAAPGAAASPPTEGDPVVVYGLIALGWALTAVVAYTWAACVAAAHHFRSTAAVLGGFLGAILLIVGVLAAAGVLIGGGAG